jgi:hypothetical protein
MYLTWLLSYYITIVRSDELLNTITWQQCDGTYVFRQAEYVVTFLVNNKVKKKITNLRYIRFLPAFLIHVHVQDTIFNFTIILSSTSTLNHSSTRILQIKTKMCEYNSSLVYCTVFLVELDRRFRGAYCLHQHGVSQLLRDYTPQYPRRLCVIFHIHRRENLEFHEKYMFLLSLLPGTHVLDSRSTWKLASQHKFEIFI